jgi:hypothetical protein
MDEIPQWEIAKYAVNTYSHLLPTVGTYSAGALIEFIKLAYEMDVRRQAECDAIEKCVVKIIKDWNAIRTTIRRS